MDVTPGLAPPGSDATLDEWLRWQETLHPRTIELGLDRIRQVADRLNLPSEGPCTLTVAGTNGKGSTAAFSAAIFREAGYRTGLYTSPHLLHYRERIVIDGEPADDAALCRAFVAVEQARREVPLTYFEFGSLAALWLFREARVDVQVLEVGLGGRLDAVNIVDADCAVITSIGIDHTEWLGPDRESIGREKAGILREGQRAVVADRHPPDSVLAEARRLRARLAQLGRDFDFSPRDGSWDWHGLGARLEALPLPGLDGAVQLQNACGAIAAVQQLRERLPVGEQAIRAALPRAPLRGRLQRIGNVLLDVGHNAQAAAALADHLRARGAGRVWLVLGMLADKAAEDFCRELAPFVHRLLAAGLPGPRGQSGQQLAERLRALAVDTEICPDVETALARAQEQAAEGDLIVVTGSFLTVAAALEQLERGHG